MAVQRSCRSRHADVCSIRALAAPHGFVNAGERVSDSLPSEESLRPARRGTPEALAEAGRPIEVGEPLREYLGRLGRYEKARLVVDDAVLDAADGRADHGSGASHRLERRDAERLIPRGGNEGVGRAVVELEQLAGPPAREHHSLADAFALREATQTAYLRSDRGIGHVGVT